ncbi:hypothetical protein C4D60_Mb09t22340 [Musa balbisiana]|uniref:Tify domain-containing protein n=1 Tax=Musa balbisiana TaxID=52838 RepID=A0A4S8IJ02_MUSBA|nr:hypothetical protein C4D60_Mb09t22340 [Musa balbisiana]
MGFGCDPELRLSLGGRDDDEGSGSNEQCKFARLSRVESMLRSSTQQVTTVFCNGRVYLCDATEIQVPRRHDLASFSSFWSMHGY